MVFDFPYIITSKIILYVNFTLFANNFLYNDKKLTMFLTARKYQNAVHENKVRPAKDTRHD